MARTPQSTAHEIDISEMEMLQAASRPELWLVLSSSLLVLASLSVIVVTSTASLFAKFDTSAWLYLGMVGLLLGMGGLSTFRKRMIGVIMLSRSSKKPKRKQGGTPFVNAR